MQTKTTLFTGGRAFRINLTCSGKSKAFEMPFLKFFTEILNPVLEFFAKSGDPKGRYVSD